MSETALQDWLSCDVVAAKLSVHPRTIWQWTRDGRFPQPSRFARNVTRWSAQEIAIWCESKKQQPAPPPEVGNQKSNDSL